MFGHEDFVLNGVQKYTFTHLVVNHIKLVLNEIKQSYKSEKYWVLNFKLGVCLLNKV